ncbi:MAG: AAA family ATPase [Deltaproteobacteria bacterium]|jgi:hypothetical protein|nr:AAA family ATPase [Deltaproteobacteria bacterium]
MKETKSAGKMLKDLPEGIQNFGQIIAENRLYADKTPYIYDLVSNTDRKFCFLFRPRRFGKTLFLDTLNELFLGRRELFEDLWIARETDYDFQPYPVLRLSMNYAETDSAEQLETNIISNLLAAAKSKGVAITETYYDRILKQLLEGLNKDGAGTAVLIDDYDAPVSRHFDNPKLAKASCRLIQDFLTVLQDSGELVRFVLAAGLAGFELMSEYGPDYFDDISLRPDFGGVCGFTVSEFDRLFGGRMDDLLKVLKKNGCLPPDSRTADLREQILDWYGGFNWLGPEQVLNPFSIANLFSKKKFGRYWFQNKPPVRLNELIRSRPQYFLNPQAGSSVDGYFRKVDLDYLKALPILFYSGYLTIDKEIIIPLSEGIGLHCTIKFPNREAEDGYSSLLKDSFGKAAFNSLANLTSQFLEAADRRDSEAAAGLFADLLARFPYFQPKPLESQYHDFIQECLAFGGAKVQEGRSRILGMSDIIAEYPGERYLIIAVRYQCLEKRHTEADIEQILAEESDAALKHIAGEYYAGPLRPPARELLGLSLVFYGRKEVRSDFVSEDLLKPAPARPKSKPGLKPAKK